MRRVGFPIESEAAMIRQLDEAADRAHSGSAQVKKFASILYPQGLAPVEFVDYDQVTSNRSL
jgi:hypothetical protein